MIKLIASDMDGTLLNNESEISKENLEAINKAIDKNVIFMLATGREYESVKPILEKYGLACPSLLMNGSEVRDAAGNIMEVINMKKEVVPFILKIANANGLASEFSTNRGIYTICNYEQSLKANVHRIQGYRSELSLERCHTIVKEMTRFTEQKYIENLEEFLESTIEIRRINIFSHDIKRVGQANVEINKGIEGVATLSAFSDNIEITDNMAQKGIILKNIIKKLLIRPEEVAVMGDSYNDISMFEEFKYSFAPDNARDEIKELAKYKVPSNDKSGVASAIEYALKL